MIENFKLIVSLVLGIGLAIYGSLTIYRRTASIGIGAGGTASSKPLGILTLTGPTAILFGMSMIIAGIISIMPLITVLFPEMLPVELNQSLTFVALAVLAIAIMVFIFSAFVQLAINAGKGLRQPHEKDDRK